MNTDQIEYYERRAPEYDRLYAKLSRQKDLKAMVTCLQDIFKGRSVLEIATGTGWWTPYMAETAERIVATDINQSVLDIAESRSYPKGNVTFEIADVYQLDAYRGFSGLFAGYMWSHVSKHQLHDFLVGAFATVEPGAPVVFIDNLYIDTKSTPLAGQDEHGNSLQKRSLDDGSEYLILKNYPTEAEIREALAPFSSKVEITNFEYYWLATAYCSY